MWIYKQSSGRIFSDLGDVIGGGYSGAPGAENNPLKDNLPNVGPIPRGLYTIGDPQDTKTHGPFVLPLTPDPRNVMHGRSGFLFHGDSVERPGQASEGCIVIARAVREHLASSADKRLVVIA